MTFNPFDIIARKQKVGQEAAGELALPSLIYLDAAKRGVAPVAAENGLVLWVVTCQVIGSKLNSRPFYDLAVEAARHLLKSGQRETELMSLTTGEYMALKRLMAAYLRILPTLEVGAFAFCAQRAEEHIMRLREEADDD